MALSLGNIFAQGITFQTDATTGAIAQLAIDNDAQKMNWVLTPDGKQNPISHKGELVYQAGNIRISVKRALKNGELFEEYTFKNTGKTAAQISDWGIYTPWNDNYPDAATCITNRCNAHIWAGDNAPRCCLLW